MRGKVRQACRLVRGIGDFKLPELFLTLVIHIILGYRELDDVRFYRDDPLVLRVLGLRRLPSTATLSRRLRAVGKGTITNLQDLNRTLILDRLVTEKLRRVTLDFDGSVLSTRRHAEGTAVGFNRKRKGERSYYPLLCTVAQTGQIFDALPRSRNVHDSNGALAFITDSVLAVDQALPGRVIENRERWGRIDDTWPYFETSWKPKKWLHEVRFVFIRQTSHQRLTGPIQLDLFEPRSRDYSYKVIMTNKKCSAKSVMLFHHGRGSQEGLIGEAKSSAMMDYVPTRSWAGNLFYMLASITAHNVTRELQMRTTPPRGKADPKRAAMWTFEKLESVLNKLVRRAGRLNRPDGKLTLTLNRNEAVQAGFDKVMRGLKTAA